MQYNNLEDLNEAIRNCSKCDISKLGFPKTLGQGDVTSPSVFFVCQKPHLLKDISLDAQRTLWEKHGSGGFFTYNLRFYEIACKAGLLSPQEETEKKLDDLRQISLKADPEKWWTIRGHVCRQLLETNHLYLSECVKCPTPNNRHPKVSEVRCCSQ